MVAFQEIRKYQYDYHKKHFPFLNDWLRNPYTWLKARFYMESSAILVFFLVKTKIKPNTITLLYVFCGVVGGILLSLPSKMAILLALFIFFTKGILDWSDGHLARATGQTSLTGAVLDPYGALINSLGFWIGFGFYLVYVSGNQLFYYLIPVYPALMAGDIILFANDKLVGVLSKVQFNVSDPSFSSSLLTDKPKSKNPLLNLWRGIIEGFPDDRARTIDLVCFLIVLELFTGLFFSWIIFLLFIFKALLLFLSRFYKVYSGSWERESKSCFKQI